MGLKEDLSFSMKRISIIIGKCCQRRQKIGDGGKDRNNHGPRIRIRKALT